MPHIVVSTGIAAILTASACAQNIYVNQALARGVSYNVGNTSPILGAGVAMADLNNDGHLDLIIAGANSGVVAIFENNGSGSFINRTAASGIGTHSFVSSVTAADYDADGDLDIHLTRSGQPDKLFRNNGNFTFTDVSVAAGIASTGWGMGATWGDYDGDGWLDLYVCNRTGTADSSGINTVENHLFRNNGDGTFTDVAVALGVQSPADPTLLALFFDFDNDGDPDLYLGTDKGSGGVLTNHFFRNDGGTFTDITASSGTAAYIDCMGFAVGDITGNGFPDVYMTNIPDGNLLLLNNGDETFTDATAASGLEIYQTGWATAFLDYDNDSILDVFICNELAPNRLFRGETSLPFTDVSATSGLNELATSFCFAYGDIDGDGDLDLLVTNNNQPARVFINTQGQDNNWVKLNIIGRDHNTRAVGAVARVTANGITQMREVFNGANYKSQNTFTLHYGLGTYAGTIDTIEVRWPNSSIQRTLHNYDIKQTWTIYPPSRLGDSNHDGLIDAVDILDAISVMDALNGSPISPGQEIYDINGDSFVTVQDIYIMLRRASRTPHAANVYVP